MTVCAYRQVADDGVDGVGAEGGADGAVPVDAAQQSPGGVSGLVEDVVPVAPGGDGVGERVAAAGDGDGLAGRVLVGFGGADAHLEAVGDLAYVVAGERDEFAAAAPWAFLRA
ncbi:hypothetical protein ACWEPC_39230, partial [Nonomuraea sp. NPDC004297]